MAAYLELLPAVDIKGGQAVQLVQGVDGSEKRFGDPVEAALRWQDAGAEWIHLVDLDAASMGSPNRFSDPSTPCTSWTAWPPLMSTAGRSSR